ncbi:Sorbose reductase SOU1 [Pyrenophora tritici-repentis]|nr:Sorbose reductase SOU1 [Pyrenophora tritici-repentis]
MSMSIDECQQPRAGFPKPVPDTPTNVMQQFSMKGKTIVITGAAEGIGGAVADAMAEAGGNVALWYNTNPKAKERAETLAKEHNVQTKTYSVDQTSATAVEAAIKQVVADFGRIDCFVANAGTGDSKPLLDQTLDSYHNLLKVNVDGPVYCAKYAGEVFKKQGFGNLILTSSISAHIVNVPIDQPIYNGTKAFVSHLGKSLAREWREFARVNIVSPGFFDTKMGAGPKVINEGLRMIPLGRQGNVKEIKGLFLTKLRNLVYEFAAVSEQPIQIACKTPKASQKGDTVQENKKARTYAGLTSVCRQVRKEYLPIQRREVNLRINLWDLEKFFATFDLLHWATTSQPRGLDISIPFPLYRTSKIDILPLVQLYSLGHLTTTVPVPPTEEDVEVEEIGSPLYKKMDTEQWMIVDRYMRDIQENWDHEPFFTGRVKKIDYFPRISMPPRIVLMTRDPAL